MNKGKKPTSQLQRVLLDMFLPWLSMGIQHFTLDADIKTLKIQIKGIHQIKPLFLQ